MLKKLFSAVLALTFVFALSFVAMADNTDNQLVTINVDVISELGLGTEVTFTISAGIAAGDEPVINPVPASIAGTISYTSNDAAPQKITLQITAGALPADVNLNIDATDNGGGAGEDGVFGNVDLTSVAGGPSTLINNIGQCYSPGNTLTYALTATGAAGWADVAPGTYTPTITYTLQDV